MVYNRTNSLFFIAALLILSGCNAPKKALNNGDYEIAVRLSVDKLRSKPKNRSARDVLQRAHPLAVNYHSDRIRTYLVSNDPFRWEPAVSSYEQLNDMYSRIQRCPACLELVPEGRLYIDELNEARGNAAQNRYDTGVQVLDTQDRQRGKEAYNHFMVVERMIPDYRDTRKLMAKALYAATLHVVVDPIPMHSRSLHIGNEFFYNKLMEFLSGNRRMNEFVRFYSHHEAERVRMNEPDHFVSLVFDDFVIGQTLLESHSDRVTSSDSVVTGEVTLPDGSKAEVKALVTATFTRFKKTVISGGRLDLQIIDGQNGRVILQEKLPGEFVWMSEWGTFKGDERALTESQKRLSRLREHPTPAPQDMFIEFTLPIYGQLTERLRRFYSGF